MLTIIPPEELLQGNASGRFFGAAHDPYRTGEVIFSHEPHSHADCWFCHPGGSDEQAVRQGGLPSMARCFECHDGEQAGRACENCHQLERVGRKPSTHDGPWQRLHGRDVRAEAYQCALCHAEPECQGCHAVQKPQSHTLRFLRSTHGRLAVHQRSSCATCHEADFCENCHREPPPDHTSAFVAGGHKQVARLRGRSCLTCHRFQPDCSPCHGG